MTTKELMLGNIVWHIFLGLAIVKEIRVDGITLGDPKNEDNFYFERNENIHRLEPLEVTEQILIQFGFSMIGPWFTKGNIHYNLSSHSLYIGNDHVSGGHVDCVLPFVHELQNVLKALKKND